MFLGQSEGALEAAASSRRPLPEELLRVEVPPMADWLEGFVAMRLHALIRFGRWQDILDTPLPDDPDLYCVTTAMTHYARGVAFAATGRVDEAEEQRRCSRPRSRGCRESRTLFNNTCLDILAVAAAMLDGELEYREGNLDDGVRAPAPGDRARRRAALRRAVGLDAADPARLRRAAARAGPRRGGRGRLPRRPGPRRHAAAGAASIPATSGACTATTSAWCGSARPSRPGSSGSSSTSPPPTPTSPSTPRAPAASARCRVLNRAVRHPSGRRYHHGMLLV